MSPEPAGHRRRRAAQPAGAPGPPAAGSRAVVERAEGGVDAPVVAAEVGARAVGVAAAEHEPPAPQPLGLRHPGRHGADLDVRRQAEHRPHRGQAGERRAPSSTSSPIGATRSTRPVASSTPELAALGRLEGAERAPQQGDDVLEGVGPQRGDPRVDGGQQLAVVEQDGAAAGEEALDERRAVGGRRARRERPAEAGLDVGRRPPPASWSRRVARPCTSPWTRRPPASVLEHGGQLAVTGRVVDDGERGLDRAHPLDHRPRRVVVEALGGPRQAGDRPARRARRTRPAADAASVPRTSP